MFAFLRKIWLKVKSELQFHIMMEKASSELKTVWKETELPAEEFKDRIVTLFMKKVSTDVKVVETKAIATVTPYVAPVNTLSSKTINTAVGILDILDNL